MKVAKFAFQIKSPQARLTRLPLVMVIASCVVSSLALSGCLQLSLVGSPTSSSTSSSSSSASEFFRGRWIDSSGNFYIADSENSAVRKVTASSGDISTVAGISNFRLHANLAEPYGVALDSSGNLYVSDSGIAPVVFKMTASGITVVAGNLESSGYSGDNGPATSAELNGATGIALDSSNNLYIADSQNYIIRKVNALTGVITTVAGTPGSPGYSGDGGPATSAQIYQPQGVALDSSNNLYIADTENNIVREVNAATGIITTIAGTPSSAGYSGDGGAATSAKLSGPQGIGLDKSGNIFIADSNNYVIREVNATTGIITTVAGNNALSFGYSGDGGAATSAQLNGPNTVALDSSNNLYIADTGNYVVRKVDAGTGIITTLAGDHSPGYTGDGGAATSAELYVPVGLALDGSMNLYIADESKWLREVDSGTGIISTAFANGSAGYSGDNGPATSAQLKFPVDVALDTSNNLYVSDYNNNVVQKVNAVTGIITTVAGGGGSYGDGGPATSAQLNASDGIAMDTSNNLYIADSNNHTVRKVDATTGIITTVAGTPQSRGYSGDGGPATSAQLRYPQGVALDRAGNLYIADSENNVIREVDAATGIISTVAGNGFDAGSWSGGYSGDNGPATSAELDDPGDVLVDNSGNIYISDGVNNVIREVNAITGIITTIAGTGFGANTWTGGYSGDNGPATSAELAVPGAISLDSLGNLYIQDSFNNVVRKVDAITGIITTVAGNGNGAGVSNAWQWFSGDGGAATSAELSWPGSTAW